MKPITYIEQTVTLHVRDGQKIVNAQVASNGLAYCLTPYPDGSFGPDLTVVHAQSGCDILDGNRSFATPEQCQLFIALVDLVEDWTKEADALRGKTRVERRAHARAVIPFLVLAFDEVTQESEVQL